MDGVEDCNGKASKVGTRGVFLEPGILLGGTYCPEEQDSD